MDSSSKRCESVSKIYQRFVRVLVPLLQYEKGLETIHSGLHDLPHLSLTDVREFRLAVARGAGFTRMDAFNRAVTETESDQCLGFSGHSGRSSTGVSFFMGCIVERIPKLAGKVRGVPTLSARTDRWAADFRDPLLQSESKSRDRCSTLHGIHGIH
jgi:hypothetical protein